MYIIAYIIQIVNFLYLSITSNIYFTYSTKPVTILQLSMHSGLGYNFLQRCLLQAVLDTENIIIFNIFIIVDITKNNITTQGTN